MEEQQRKQIFYEELVKLLKVKYINNKEYEKITFLHSKYYNNKKIQSQDKLVEETVAFYDKVEPKVKLQKQAPVQVKKKLSQKEISDRNISLVLILGVVLVLLSGLVLATSNWDMLTNTLKTVLIILVSVLFFAISIVGDRVLKIEKTAFAFWVLGSLFLPVAILSAGYFKLFGDWLSVMGEGRYLLGVIGAVICVPIYIYSARRYNNRFFVWISYITITIGVYNLIAAFRPEADLFFFVIVIYNSIVMLSYARLKNSDHNKLFTKELYSFAQINLMISTILTTFTFIDITKQVVVNNQNNPTIMMAITYLIISVNFIYLSYTSNKKVFNYAAPLFIVATGLELCRVVQGFFIIDITAISIFIIALLLFFLIYDTKLSKYLCNMRNSSGSVSYILVAAAVFFSLSEKQWVLSTFILYFSSYMLYLVYCHCKNNYIIRLTKWHMPLNILLGTFVLFGKISEVYSNTPYDAGVHFGFSVLVLFLLSLGWNKVNKSIMNAFFIVAHLFMPFSIWIIGTFHYDNPILFILPTLIYIYSALLYDKKILKKVFFYSGLVTATLTLSSLFALLKLDAQQNYVMIMITVVMVIFWYVYEGEWADRIMPFLLAYATIGSLLFNAYALLEIKDIYPALVYVLILLFVMHKENLDYLIFIPLYLLLQVLSILDNQIVLEYNIWRIIISLGAFVALVATGRMLYKRLYQKTSGKVVRLVHIDWYSIVALFVLITILFNTYGIFTEWFHFLVFALISFLIYAQTNRVEEGKIRKIVITLSIVSLILPYYKLIDNLTVPSIILTELELLPFLVIITVLYKKIWKNSSNEIRVLSNINTFVIVGVSLILLKDVAMDNYLIDRLILGALSLIAIFIGMQFKVKIYFLAGIMTLIINVLIQTKDLWLNIPWWGYLLLSGLILIGMASYNEVRKNKNKDKIDDEVIDDPFEE